MKIAITGPESSGKTTLTTALAESLSWIPVYEYAREYLTDTNGEYQFEDLEEIANGHYKSMLDSGNNIIVDTDFVVMKVWSDVRFGSTSERIIELVESNLFDLHILCTPDIPWEPDPLRENPEDRKELYQLYLKELNNSKKIFISVSGSHEHRLKEALSEIQKLLSENG